MMMATSLDKIPNNNDNNIGINDLNDPIIKDVVNEIHNSFSQSQQPQQPQQFQQQFQQPLYKPQQPLDIPIEKSIIDYNILTKSIVLSIITILILTIIPMNLIIEFYKIDIAYENILKGLFLSIFFYIYFKYI
jgi:hypothetical protein